MKKLFIVLGLIGFANLGIQAQLKLNLSLLSDNETFMVSMVSEQTIEAPMNTASNVQVIFHVPSKAPFTVGNIQSLVPGINWLANSYSDELTEPQPHLFVINMKERSTTALHFEKNTEVPLFTFKNLEEGCAGELELLDNDHETIKEVVAKGMNYTQNFTVLAARGNAFNGIINGKVDCSLTDLNEIIPRDKVNIYPIPADDRLTVEWENTQPSTNLRLNLISFEGKHIKRLDGLGQSGEHSITIDMEEFAAGVYTLQFQSGDSVQDFKFIISRL